MKVKQYHVDQVGLHQFFGSLEARIMELMWNSMEKTSIRHIHETLNLESPISFNAVMTVLNRLWEKGILHKDSQGQGRTKTSYFLPLQTKEQFLAEKTREVTQGLIKEFGDVVVNHLIDTIEDVDPALLNKLEEKLEEAKKRNLL
ncbi:BlaI/MecI/CopY family transcriptional regulator [Paenibacillus sp. GYB004]|uniref:BlaI/MecI/CopY family transcriptional regulator n=1 Tax=Paenibacillus sp. GYB004 TaxID=2994393 RepID=UPI002F96A102